jgi:TatD DNase family protein
LLPESNVALIDSHLHLDFDDFQSDLEMILQRAQQAGVVQMISIGCRPDSSRRAIALAEAHDCIFATAGVHPHQAAETNDDELLELEEMFAHPRVVGLGECGLDYFYMNSPKEIQQDVFRKQIRLSLKHDLPIIIHTRDAEEDTLAILREEAPDGLRGVIHCFSSTLPFAEACLEMGLYISVSGLITFVKSLQKVVKQLPLERLLVETDSPYLAPVPHRGARNEPAYVYHTAAKCAGLFGLSLEEFVSHTTSNTRTLFGLPTPS